MVTMYDIRIKKLVNKLKRCKGRNEKCLLNENEINLLLEHLL